MKRVRLNMIFRCPECGSARLVKDGRPPSGRKRMQRWRCNNCLRRTIYPKEVRGA